MSLCDDLACLRHFFAVVSINSFDEGEKFVGSAIIILRVTPRMGLHTSQSLYLVYDREGNSTTSSSVIGSFRLSQCWIGRILMFLNQQGEPWS